MKSIPVFNDLLFRNGFICLGAAHEDGIVGTLKSPAAKKEPDWKIGQWACKNNICKGVYICGETGYSYKTASQYLAVSWDRKKPLLTLELLASEEYDSPRVRGQSWPHLLIEQVISRDRRPSLDKLSSLNLSFAFRVPMFKCMMDSPDNSLHSAQVTLYFTVQSMKTNNAFFWFGVPAFDSRYRHMVHFQAEDTGKDDASHKFIYVAGQKKFTEKSAHDGEIIEYEKDLLPFIKDGLSASVKANFLESGDISEYTLTSCNLGFEMAGTFDASFEVYRLELEAMLGE